MVSIAGILREKSTSGIELKLISLPSDPADPDKAQERRILQAFFKAVGRAKPQIVGYNSGNADVPILVQRAIVNGISGMGFGQRPDKPWEGADYFVHGEELMLQSRSIDETGYVQPTIDALQEERGVNSIYHNNAIATWLVNGDGSVDNVRLG